MTVGDFSDAKTTRRSKDDDSDKDRDIGDSYKDGSCEASKTTKITRIATLRPHPCDS